MTEDEFHDGMDDGMDEMIEAFQRIKEKYGQIIAVNCIFMMYEALMEVAMSEIQTTDVVFQKVPLQ